MFASNRLLYEPAGRQSPQARQEGQGTGKKLPEPVFFARELGRRMDGRGNGGIQNQEWGETIEMAKWPSE